jgi:hypothetical protein
VTARVLVTERAFWEHWPEVAKGFVVWHGLLRSANRKHCPITAVAERIGGESVDCVEVATVLRRVGDRVPKWADEVIAGADLEWGQLERPYETTRRRLLKYVPGATP